MSQDTFVRKTYLVGPVQDQAYGVPYQSYPTPSTASHYQPPVEQPVVTNNNLMRSPDGFLASQMNGFHLQSPANGSVAQFPSFTYNSTPPMATFLRPVKVPVSPASNAVPKNVNVGGRFPTPQTMHNGYFAGMMPQTPGSAINPVAAGQLGKTNTSPTELPHGVPQPALTYYSTPSDRTISHKGSFSQDTVPNDTSPGILDVISTEITPEDLFATLTETEEGDFPDTTNVTIDDILKEDPFVDMKHISHDPDTSFMSCFLDLDEFSGDDVSPKQRAAHDSAGQLENNNQLNGLGITNIEMPKKQKAVKRSVDKPISKARPSAPKSELGAQERTLKKSKSFSGQASINTKSGSGSPNTPSARLQPKFSFSECAGAFSIQSLYSFVLESLAMVGNKPSTSRKPERPLMKRAVTHSLGSSPTGANGENPPQPLKNMESGCRQFQINLGK